MLLARATTVRGDDLLIIGLSKENRRRLDAGQPIDVHGTAVPHALHIVIFAGETEESMQRELGDLIGRETVVERRAVDRRAVDRRTPEVQ